MNECHTLIERITRTKWRQKTCCSVQAISLIVHRCEMMILSFSAFTGWNVLYDSFVYNLVAYDQLFNVTQTNRIYEYNSKWKFAKCMQTLSESTFRSVHLEAWKCARNGVYCRLLCAIEPIIIYIQPLWMTWFFLQAHIQFTHIANVTEQPHCTLCI